MKLPLERTALWLTIKFLIVGVVGFVTNFVILKLTNGGWNWPRVVAEIAAAIVALQVTFVLHDRWTYREHNHKLSLPVPVRYGSYLVSNSFGSLLTVVFFALFARWLQNLYALALAAAIAMVWNFVMNKVVIWRHKGAVNEELNVSAD